MFDRKLTILSRRAHRCQDGSSQLRRERLAKAAAFRWLHVYRSRAVHVIAQIVEDC